MGPLQLGSHDQNFPKNIIIMGYNFTNARIGLDTNIPKNALKNLSENSQFSP